MQIAPWMIDLVLVGVALEFGLIALLLKQRGAGRWILPVLWFLVSGALLLTAVRGALSGASHGIIGGVLLASFGTHLACLWSAWQQVGK